MDLEEAIRKGRFREDLYYRICVLSLELPPLRERGEDCLLFARAFLRDAALRFGKSLQGFTSDAEALLLDHDWPGNLRELRNTVERASLHATGKLVTVEALGFDEGRSSSSTEMGKEEAMTYEQAIAGFERQFLVRALGRHDGAVTATARSLGLSRFALHRRLTRLGLGKQKN